MVNEQENCYVNSVPDNIKEYAENTNLFLHVDKVALGQGSRTSKLLLMLVNIESIYPIILYLETSSLIIL